MSSYIFCRYCRTLMCFASFSLISIQFYSIIRVFWILLNLKHHRVREDLGKLAPAKMVSKRRCLFLRVVVFSRVLDKMQKLPPWEPQNRWFSDFARWRNQPAEFDACRRFPGLMFPRLCRKFRVGAEFEARFGQKALQKQRRTKKYKKL